MSKRARTQSESSYTLSNGSFNYKTPNEEAGVEVHHRVRQAKAGRPLDLEKLVNIICPPLKFKYTWPSNQLLWSENQEFVLETVCLDKFMLQGMKRLITDTSGNPVFVKGPPGNTDGAAYASSFKFEGGKWTYRAQNTCNNTVYLEFREFKKKSANAADPGTFTIDSPLNCWHRDQSQNTTHGQLPYNLLTSTEVMLQNNTNLSSWTVNNSSNPAVAGGLETINSAFIPCFKRPNRSSPQLRSNWDAGSVTKVELKPGQTFIYEVVINPFYLSKAKDMSNDLTTNNILQFYTRIVQIFMRSQFNTMDIDQDGAGPDTGATDNIANARAFAPGPGQIHIVKSFEANVRSIPNHKVNNVIEGSGNTITAGSGPFTSAFLDTIDSIAVHMDADDGQVKYNET